MALQVVFPQRKGTTVAEFTCDEANRLRAFARRSMEFEVTNDDLTELEGPDMHV
jgi:hypothetical protein